MPYDPSYNPNLDPDVTPVPEIAPEPVRLTLDERLTLATAELDRMGGVNKILAASIRRVLSMYHQFVNEPVPATTGEEDAPGTTDHLDPEPKTES
jgi:hypothetical protein